MEGRPDSAMEYLWWQEQQDQQGALQGSTWNEQPDAFNASNDQGVFQSFSTGTSKGREYWLNASPVLEKVDYNGEVSDVTQAGSKRRKVCLGSQCYL